ncbi:MAG: hypothetical protein H7233_14325 [Pseudorhodobacter sp.]|nr:hypothetical protein [Frankiaceae bacterium]
MAADARTGGPYAREAGPGDSGVRVTLRYRLPDGRATDVLGVLESWADGSVVVRRRDDTCVTVDEPTVLAVRRIPPPPVRR